MSTPSVTPAPDALMEPAAEAAAPNTAVPESSTEGGVVPTTLMPSAPAASGTDVPPAAPIALPSDAPTLVVSLTFDDTLAPQRQAAAILEAHGLRGTFYVNSPRLHDGTANGAESIYMSLVDALALQSRGHEIGGHTLSHPQLTTLPESERIREIVGDRAQLLALGLTARSFAYPRGDVEAESDPSLGASVLEVMRSSGYSSARDTNGVSATSCTVGAESLPPLDVYRLRSVRSVNDAPPAPAGAAAPPPDTTDTLLGWMDHAASCGGGWLSLIFHHLRDDCAAPDGPGSYCFDFSELERLAALLSAGARCPIGGTVPCYRIAVQTVSGALGDTAVAPAREVFGLRNASFERTLASGNAECAQSTQGSGGTALLSRSTDLARTGSASARMEIAEPFVAPAEIRVSRDFGACAPFAAEGRAYDLAVHYRAEPGTSPTLRFVTYRLTAALAWEPWTFGEPFTALTPGEWVRHAFRTEPVPPGTVAFSFGLRLESAGAVNVDDLDGSLVVQ